MQHCASAATAAIVREMHRVAESGWICKPCARPRRRFVRGTYRKLVINIYSNSWDEFSHQNKHLLTEMRADKRRLSWVTTGVWPNRHLVARRASTGAKFKRNTKNVRIATFKIFETELLRIKITEHLNCCYNTFVIHFHCRKIQINT